MGNDVVFRRVHGRIIPMRTNKSTKAQATANGVGLVGAGIASTIGAGHAYRAINSAATAKSAKAIHVLDSITRKFGPVQGSLFSFARKAQAEKLASKALSRAAFMGKFAAPIRLGSLAIGSALIGAGAAKIYEGQKKEKLDTGTAAKIGAGVATAAFIVGAHKGAGFRQVIKPIYIKAYPHIRKLKGLLKL